MSRRRVVVTGVGLMSPIGNSYDEVAQSLRYGRHGIRYMSEWDGFGHLATRVAAPVAEIPDAPLNRKRMRTMGRVSVLALHATAQALGDAGLSADYVSSSGVGLAYGSTHGSTAETENFCRKVFGSNSFAGVPASSYLKFMSHTCASNLAAYYGIHGRIITTCSACVSSSQAIGFGYEAVRSGVQETMICGGAEELHVTHAGVFDVMFATSRKYNATPAQTPRPFDVARDGLVVGEGAATVILEPLERARARGAKIYAEVLGFGTNSDGTTVTSPSAEGTAGALRAALEDAALAPETIDYVNAHGTATELGDIAESEATRVVLGENVPISSTKSYTGHTLGACGGLEAIFCFAMMEQGFVAPTRNLERVDPRCAPLNHVIGDPRDMKVDTVMSNNFAFGGINTSLIFGRV